MNFSSVLYDRVEDILRDKLGTSENDIKRFSERTVDAYVKDDSTRRGKHEIKKYLDAKLIELISSPKWNRGDNGAYVATLRPDTVSIYTYNDRKCFSILDAKYYTIQFKGNSVSDQPKVGDITKQYLYQLAYNEFIDQHNIEYVQNLFLFPGVEGDKEYGSVDMDFFDYSGGIKLVSINAVKLPAAKMYDVYLSGNPIEEKDYLDYFPKPKIVQYRNLYANSRHLLRYIQRVRKSPREGFDKKTLYNYCMRLLETMKGTIKEEDKRRVLNSIRCYDMEKMERSNEMLAEAILRGEADDDLKNKVLKKISEMTDLVYGI